MNSKQHVVVSSYDQDLRDQNGHCYTTKQV